MNSYNPLERIAKGQFSLKEDARETWNIYFGRENRLIMLSSFTLAVGLYLHNPLLAGAGLVGIGCKFYSSDRDAKREEILDR